MVTVSFQSHGDNATLAVPGQHRQGATTKTMTTAKDTYQSVAQ